MSPLFQIVENLSLIAGGGCVTMGLNQLADRRARHRAEEEMKQKTLEQEIAELRAKQNGQALELARLHGRLDERDHDA